MNQEEEDQNWLDGIFVKLALEPNFLKLFKQKQRQFYGFYSYLKTSFGQKKVVKCEIM